MLNAFGEEMNVIAHIHTRQTLGVFFASVHNYLLFIVSPMRYEVYHSVLYAVVLHSSMVASVLLSGVSAYICCMIVRVLNRCAN